MAITDLSEEEIISKIKELKRNENAYLNVIKSYFEEIYNRFYIQCYNIARFYGLSKQDAEDAVQETFLKFMSRVKSFDRKRKFKPWFFKILINTIKDKYKYLKKIQYLDIETFNNLYEKSDKIEELQLKESLKVIISRLPEKLKLAVLLRNYTDIDLETIARLSNITVRQLHNRLSKAYKIIIENLDK